MCCARARVSTCITLRHHSLPPNSNTPPKTTLKTTLIPRLSSRWMSTSSSLSSRRLTSDSRLFDWFGLIELISVVWLIVVVWVLCGRVGLVVVCVSRRVRSWLAAVGGCMCAACESSKAPSLFVLRARRDAPPPPGQQQEASRCGVEGRSQPDNARTTPPDAGAPAGPPRARYCASLSARRHCRRRWHPARRAASVLCFCCPCGSAVRRSRQDTHSVLPATHMRKLTCPGWRAPGCTPGCRGTGWPGAARCAAAKRCASRRAPTRPAPCRRRPAAPSSPGSSRRRR